MYDLNQIPYDYKVEVKNKFKGLDLIDRLPEEPEMEIHNNVQEAVTKLIPKKKKCKKAKWLSEVALQIAKERREVKGKGERKRYIQLRASQVLLVVKNLPANSGDLRDTGLIPELGRSPGGGNGNPLQYSCLKDPMNRGA